MTHVRIYTGPAFSERTRIIHRNFQHDASHSILVVPTQKGARFRQSEIITEYELPGIFGENVTTFEGLVRQLLRDTPFEAKLIDATQQRLILSQSIQSVLDSEEALAPLKSVMTTPGFITHLLRTINQIKQSAFTPHDLDRLYERKNEPTVMDQAISAVYRTYQQQLVENQLYDLPGMFWMADVCCIESQPQLFQQYRTVIFDGFDDFTPSEFRLLESMAIHLKDLNFGLAMDQHPNREDAYTLVRQTLGKLVGAFPENQVIECEPSAPLRMTEYVFQNLFWRDQANESNVASHNLSFLHCHSVTHELESIARRIRCLISDDNVAPSSIAVVGRGLPQQFVALNEVFSEFNVPLNTTQSLPATSSPMVRSITNALKAVTQWDRIPVLNTLTDPLIGPWNSSTLSFRSRFATLIRCAQVRGGKLEWIRAFETLSKETTTPTYAPFPRLVETMPDAESAFDAMRERFEWLMLFEESCPRNAHVSEFVNQIGQEFLNPESIDQRLTSMNSNEAEGFVSVLSTIQNLLENLRLFPSTRDKVKRQDWIRIWTDMAQSMLIMPSTDSSGVLCTDPETARHLKFDYVFWMDVQEGVYPNPVTINAVVPEAERNRLRQLGLPFDADESLVLRERMLFLRMLAVARIDLVVSWHTRLTNGQEGRPSPFLTELNDLPIEIPVHKPDTVTDTLVPPTELVRCERDALNFFQVAGGVPETMNVSSFPSMTSGNTAEAQRQNNEFNAFDAHLKDHVTLSEIGAAYGDDHVFSANQLETWLSCPFRFFMERVLTIAEWPDIGNELDPRLRGTIYHDVLELFYREFSGRPHSELDVDASMDFLEQALERVCNDQLWKQKGLTRGILEIEAERIRIALRQYLVRMLEEGDAHWAPSHLEVSFGDTKTPSHDGLSKDTPYVYESSLGPLRFSGRIDRIDRTDDNQFRIVDYKGNAGSLSNSVRDGKVVQLKLYACAAEESLLPGHSCIDSRYVGIMKFGELEVLKIDKKNSLPWSTQKEELWETIESVVQHIRLGHFHPTHEEDPCKGCPNSRVCRFDRTRLARKPVSQ